MPISDRKMFQLYREREELKERVAKLNKRIKQRNDALIAEFERRGTKAITDRETGAHVTYVQAETVVYDQPEMVKRLKRSPKGRSVVARCEKTIVDMKAIAAEVQAGNISPEIVAACSEIKKAAPYINGGLGNAE